MTLETELSYFEANRAAFLREHNGKFALIKGDRCYDFYDTAQAAYEKGVDLFGADCFLIKQLLPEDVVEQAPALMLGLLSAPV